MIDLLTPHYPLQSWIGEFFRGSLGLDEFIAFLVAQGIRRIKLNPVRLIGRAAHQAQLQVSVDEIGKSFQSAISRHVPQPGFRAGQSESELPANCGVGQFLNIMPNGVCFPVIRSPRANFSVAMYVPRDC